MLVAVSAAGEDLDAQVDPRFGRCKFFIIVDIDTMDYKAIPNEGAMAPSGAGIQAAQTVGREGVKTILTGNVGPNANQTLIATGIKVVTGVSGRIKDVLEKYKRDELNETTKPTVQTHAGMGKQERRRERARRRGQGAGCGRMGSGRKRMRRRSENS